MYIYICMKVIYFHFMCVCVCVCIHSAYIYLYKISAVEASLGFCDKQPLSIDVQSLKCSSNMHGGPLGGAFDKCCWDCRLEQVLEKGSWSANVRRHRGCPRCPATGTLTQLLGTLVVTVLHD